MNNDWSHDPNYIRAFKAATHANQKKVESQWVIGFWASKIVGKYERGATSTLAQACNCSDDTIERLARAYTCYHVLMLDARQRKARRQQRELRKQRGRGYLFFYRKSAGVAMGEESVSTVLADLKTAELSGASPESMPTAKTPGPASWQKQVERHRQELLGLVDQAPTKSASKRLTMAINQLDNALKAEKDRAKR